jgi:hypothetical protein
MRTSESSFMINGVLFQLCRRERWWEGGGKEERVGGREDGVGRPIVLICTEI